ncbi:MAG: hypothetical protein ACJATI_005339 [Halioglobus sp.]|jgi:hypothetical protein
MKQLKDEEYSIMTERPEIFPTRRYSVIVINDDNAVIPNISVKLIDNQNNIVWETLTVMQEKQNYGVHHLIIIRQKTLII